MMTSPGPESVTVADDEGFRTVASETKVAASGVPSPRMTVDLLQICHSRCQLFSPLTDYQDSGQADSQDTSSLTRESLSRVSPVRVMMSMPSLQLERE